MGKKHKKHKSEKHGYEGIWSPDSAGTDTFNNVLIYLEMQRLESACLAKGSRVSILFASPLLCELPTHSTVYFCKYSNKLTLKTRPAIQERAVALTATAASL